MWYYLSDSILKDSALAIMSQVQSRVLLFDFADGQ